MNTKYIVKLFYNDTAEYYGSEDIISSTCIVEPLENYAKTFETQENAQNYINKHMAYLINYGITKTQIIEIKSSVMQDINLKGDNKN